MADVTIYDYWRSSASYRVRIALNLKGIEFKSVPVNLLDGSHQTKEHRQRNPQGFVPALAIDGMMMTQSLAIIEYLDWRMPQPPLIPADPADAARLRAIAYAIAMDTHPICNPSVVAHHAAAFNGTFLHGKKPGLADIVLVPQLYNARRWGVALKNMPRLVAVEEACLSLAAFMAAAPESVRPADG